MDHATQRREKAGQTTDGRPSVLLLAAGSSSRFQGTKQLAKIDGETLLERVLRAVPRAKVREIVVVVGHRGDAVARGTGADARVRFVTNQDYTQGMATSIRAGLLSLAKDTSGAMLLLADQPFVTRPLLLRMLSAFRQGGLSVIVAASHRELVTPPIIFPRACFRELEALQGDRGARVVIERHTGSVTLVRVRSSAVLADIDTKEDLEAARRLLEPGESRK